MFSLRIEKKAERDLLKISADFQKKIGAALRELQENPYLGKKLEGELKGNYSYRVWPHRIIYRIYKDLVLVVVVRIGHRQGVYK